MQKHSYITDFTGICNRLEALVLAFAIRERHGHEIRISWPECDALQVAGVRVKKPGLFSFYNRIKIRDCDAATFERLSQFHNVWIRGLFGAPDELADRCLPKVAESLKLLPALAETVRKTLATGNRPLVGVHVRRGDFTVAQNGQFNLAQQKYNAVPDWLLLHGMKLLKARCPEVRFLICCTGDRQHYRALFDQFDCFCVESQSPYGYKGPGHASSTHPVADLFALACCDVVLATPASSFSHWAANVLGKPATVIMPPGEVSDSAPRLVKCKLGQTRLPKWNTASRNGIGVEVIQSAKDMPMPGVPHTEWL
ncbi:MAG: alpha-1,2-fucosyltransferase [Verrucomicrobiota bacterium]